MIVTDANKPNIIRVLRSGELKVMNRNKYLGTWLDKQGRRPGRKNQKKAELAKQERHL